MAKLMVAIDRYVLRAILLRMVSSMVDILAGADAPAETVTRLRRSMTLAIEEAVRELPPAPMEVDRRRL